jgi:hypothetical protein
MFQCTNTQYNNKKNEKVSNILDIKKKKDTKLANALILDFQSPELCGNKFSVA